MSEEVNPNDLNEGVRETKQRFSRLANLTRNKYLGRKVIIPALILLAIPLTIVLSSQQQTTENHAAPPTGPESNGYIVVFKDKPLADNVRTNLSGTSSTSEKSIEDLRLNLESQHKIIKTNLLSILNASSFITEKPSSSRQVQLLGEFENGINAVVLDINSDQANKLKTESPYVEGVYPNIIVHETLMDSVPLINASRAWGVKDSGNLNVTGRGVNVAIIDTGVDYRSPDLGSSAPGQIYNSKVVDGKDFVNDDEDPMDDRGHGTHVAGIIAGNGALKGVAPGANIIAYKVLDSNGSGDFAKVINAIEAAIGTHINDSDPSNDISIISLSLGAYCGTSYTSTCGPDDKASQEIDKANSYGIVTIVAAGNSGSGVGTINTPGTARTAITVGSINKNKTISSFSSRGPVTVGSEIINKPDVVAPGEGYPVSDNKDPRGGICSTKSSNFTINAPNCLDSSHVALMGTSMATPHVAGIAALIKQKYPQYTSSDIKYLITQNATSLGYDANTQGKGMVDAAKIFSISPTLPIITLIPSPVPVITKDITITAYQDSYVDIDHTGSNYGTLSKMKIDGSPREVSYIKFDLAPLKGKKIVSAKLKLKVPTADGSGSSNKFSIKKVDGGDWSETGVKYSNKPSLGSTIATFTGKGGGNLISVDVKSAVAGADGAKVSWGISSDGSNELILYSRNASSSRPQIVIQYQ